MITEYLLARNTVTTRARRTTEQLHRELSTTETPQTRRHHLATVLLYLGARFDGHHLIAEVDRPRYRTAQWVADTLPPEHVTLKETGKRHRIQIARPAAVLAPFGYRIGPHGTFWAHHDDRDATQGICRGAIHATGILTTNGLYITCPDTLAAAMLETRLGHLGIITRVARTHGLVVSIPFADVAHALAILGAPNSAATLRQWAAIHEPGQLQDANSQRSSRAADRSLPAARRALGYPLTSDQHEAVRLRLAHPNASLAELAAKANPPVTKDMYAGRLRRALASTAAPMEALAS